jgi:transcription initiation factor TFIIIB Brf1 subunit/transcription initiation factor TFIIB
MYGIVRCPECGSFQGVDLSNASISCKMCGKRHTMKKLLIQGPFRTQEEMRAALWDAKSGKMNSVQIDLNREMLESTISRKESTTTLSKSGRLNLIIDLIKNGNRKIENLKKKTESYGITENELEDLLNLLHARGRIYCPEMNVYEVVED